MTPIWHVDVFRPGLSSNVTFGIGVDSVPRNYNNFLFNGEQCVTMATACDEN